MWDAIGGTTGTRNRAIVQISIKHPMACAVQRNVDLARYASEVARATLLLVTSADDPLLSGQRCGGWDDTGTGKSVRFAKFWAVRNALRSYDEVALMDDTLVVNRASPNIFTIRSRSGVVGAEDHYPRTRSCGKYRVPARLCVPGHEVNSGLLVFRRAEHLHMFEGMPCDDWGPLALGNSHKGYHYDHALFNAMLLKFNATVYDLNLGKRECAEPDLAPEHKRPPTCFVVQGRWLQTHDARSHAGLCMAHVTRGASSQREHLLCRLPHVLSCARRTVLEAGNGTGAQHDHEPTRQGHESGLSQQVT